MPGWVKVVDIRERMHISHRGHLEVCRKPLILLRDDIAHVVVPRLHELGDVGATLLRRVRLPGEDLERIIVIRGSDARLTNAQAVQRRMDEIENLLVGSWVPVLLIVWHILKQGGALEQLILELRRDQRARFMDAVNGGGLPKSSGIVLISVVFERTNMPVSGSR